MRFALFSFLALGLAACAPTALHPSSEKLILSPASFNDLAGWQNDAPQDALVAFQHSCKAIEVKSGNASMGIAGKVSAWQWACIAADKTPLTDEDARSYFEEWFQPYSATGSEGANGLFTGYYVPELRGSLQRTDSYQTPLYAEPSDMISVDLGSFKSELKGQHIVGKIANKKLIPYDDRAAIVDRGLADRAEVLVWVSDPIDAFFLEVQGSGRIRLEDGSVLTVGYAGVNGRAYNAIGRVLADRGEIVRPVTMPAIKEWLIAHPARAQEIMNTNPSYVFFHQLPGEDVVGAEGVTLTTGRSLAVDTNFVPMGVPLWLDTTDGQGAILERLMVAQDTGGAIKGAVRGDFFWGTGANAATQAGAMQSRGRYYLLLPKTVNPNDD